MIRSRSQAGQSTVEIASRSVSSALYLGVVLGAGSAQVVPIWGVLTSSTHGYVPMVLAAHGMFVVLCLSVLVRPIPASIYFPTFYALLALDIGVATDPSGALACGAMWLALLGIAAPLLLVEVRRALALSVSGVGCMVGVIVLVHPAWDRSFLLAVLVMAPATVAAAAAFNQPLRQFATAVDAKADRAASVGRRLALVRVRASSAAEHARVLHDTVINTLGAIANGSAASDDAVRNQCTRDVRSILRMTDETRGTEAGLHSSLEDMPIPIRWLGGSAEAVDDIERLLDPRTLAALTAVILELVRNAAKHSRASEVTISAQIEPGSATRAIVVVADAGIGFVPGEEGWGLTHGVIGRARGAGIEVGLETAPGHGTRARLAVDLNPRPTAAHGDLDAPALVRKVTLEACWRWAVAVVGFALVAEVILGRYEARQTFVAALVVGAACAYAAAGCRGRAFVPTARAFAVAVAVPAAFAIALGGAAFGRERAYLMNPIILTPALVVLLVTVRTLVPLVVSLVLLVAVAAAWPVLDVAARGHSETVAVALGIQCAEFAAWAIFAWMLRREARRYASDQLQIEHDLAEVASREATEEASRRWTDAGLDRSLALLKDMSRGTVAFTDTAIQRRCAEEERHLRQFLNLSPDLLRIGTWFATALDAARARGVVLTIRAGDQDAPEEVADTLGQIVVEAVRHATPGSEVTVGLFGSPVPTLTLVAAGELANAIESAPSAALPDPWAYGCRVLGDQTLIEVRPMGATLAQMSS